MRGAARRRGVVLVGRDQDDSGVWRRAVEIGADHAINYKTSDFAEEVKRLTGGVRSLLKTNGAELLATDPQLAAHALHASTIRLSSSAEYRTGAGAYAPIPPVFGPRSPSSSRRRRRGSTTSEDAVAEALGPRILADTGERYVELFDRLEAGRAVSVDFAERSDGSSIRKQRQRGELFSRRR